MADTRKISHRYLSGRVKIAGTESLSSDRHLYVEPSQVEPNLGYPGEKSIPVSNRYYQLITIDNGTSYDRYWSELTGLSAGGITVFDESVQVGAANSTTKLDFIGRGVVATASGSISTITVNTSLVHVGTSSPSGTPEEGDLWWNDETGRMAIYYSDPDSNQWVEVSQGPAGPAGPGASDDAPATASSSGTTGDIAYDSNYLYVCVATDTWKRVELSTW